MSRFFSCEGTCFLFGLAWFVFAEVIFFNCACITFNVTFICANCAITVDFKMVRNALACSSTSNPPIDDNIVNIILQRWIRVGIHEFFCCIHAISSAASHGCSDSTSWYFKIDYSSLLLPFWFFHHLGLNLYNIFNSANDSQLF